MSFFDFLSFIVTDVIAEFISWLIVPPNEKGIKRLTTILKRVLAAIAIVVAVVAVVILIVWATSALGNLPVSSPTYTFTN